MTKRILGLALGLLLLLSQGVFAENWQIIHTSEATWFLDVNSVKSLEHRLVYENDEIVDVIDKIEYTVKVLHVNQSNDYFPYHESKLTKLITVQKNGDYLAETLQQWERYHPTSDWKEYNPPWSAKEKPTQGNIYTDKTLSGKIRITEIVLLLAYKGSAYDMYLPSKRFFK